MSKKGSFTMAKEYENFMSLERKKCHSEPIEMHFGIPWKIAVFIDSSKIWLYLRCDGKPGITEWAIHTSIKTYLTKNTGKEDNFTEKRIYSQDAISNNNIKNFEIGEFSKYIVNGNFKIRFEVEIEKFEGIKGILRIFDDDEAKKFSDICLTAGNQKFYVYRMYLASHSTYFESLFLGNFSESQKSEIELKDIDPEDFQNFLEVLYGEPSLFEYNLLENLKLADMYDAKTVTRRCEDFLIKNSKKSLKEKFDLAIQYKMDELMKKCISEIKTRQDIRSVLPEDPNTIDGSIWKEIVEKLLTIQ